MKSIYKQREQLVKYAYKNKVTYKKLKRIILFSLIIFLKGETIMKLNDLKPLLTADRVNLYIEVGVPIKFELWGYGGRNNNLSEYRPLYELDEREGDTMFEDYGHYTVDEIGIDNGETMYIGIHLE